MTIRAYGPHLKITYDKLIYNPSDTTEVISYPYNIHCSAIVITKEWTQSVLYIEKMPAILEPHETLPLNGELIWDYCINLHKQPENGERISIICRSEDIAFMYLKAIKEDKEIDLKETKPEMFL